MNPGGGLFADAYNASSDPLPNLFVLFDERKQRLIKAAFVIVFSLVSPVGEFTGTAINFLELDAFVYHQGCIATVVNDKCGAFVACKLKRLQGAPPVILKRLAFPGKYGNAGLGDSCGGVILSREDVATCPTHFGA